MFERSSPGKRGYQLPPLDVPAVDPASALGAQNTRAEIADFPEVSEVEAIRHFTRLSTQNYAIDLGLYPLGSCTMKYNPRVNEQVARIEGLAWAHPYQPESLAQGIHGSDGGARTARSPKSPAWTRSRCSPPPARTANSPASCWSARCSSRKGIPARSCSSRIRRTAPTQPLPAMAGYAVENIKSNNLGMVDVDELARAVDQDVAALMLTNPNTLGVFEEHITRIAEILHAKGAQLYMDGANMNALVGIARPGDFGADVMHLNLHKTFSTPHGGGGPGSGPVAVKQHLDPFLPKPRLTRAKDGAHDRWTWNYDLPQSIGRVRAFYGNVGMHIRALAYIMAHGGDGLRNATLDAVLNANYLRVLLEPYYDLPHQAPTLHECVFSDARQAKRGVRTGDIAKRLIDYGFHPYTVSFPLIVPGAMMIEPTETEGKAELDLFVDALISIAKEIEETPDLVLTAPHDTRTSRVDEVTAARKPILRWKPGN